MDFATLSAARYSLRKFSDRPVEPEKLAVVLEAAHNAPTAHNNQPQRVFVLQSREALEKADECMDSHFAPPMFWRWHMIRKWRGNAPRTARTTVRLTLPSPAPRSCSRQQTWDWVLHTWECLIRTSCWRHFRRWRGWCPIALIPIGYPAEGAHPARLHTTRIPSGRNGSNPVIKKETARRQSLFFASHQ